MKKSQIPSESLHTVSLPAEASMPLRTAAKVLQRDLGTRLAPAGAATDLVLHEPQRPQTGEVQRRVEQALAGRQVKDWHAIFPIPGGLHVAGATGRAVAHAVLALRDAAQGMDVATARAGFHAAAIDERLVTWDQTCNQTQRFCRGFDRERHFEEACRMGLTSVEINRSADQNVYQVTHLRRPEDPYPWVNDYGLALDMYTESELNRGTYPKDVLERNRTDLCAAAEAAARWGLIPSMMCYEPRWVPEIFFQRYPRLRGSRVDYLGRSFEPRYTLDIAQEIVLQHYRELLAGIFRLVPNLGYLHLWHLDSGSGYPYSTHLYPGPNGSQWSRIKPYGKLVCDFLGTLAEEGRRHNPEFKVIQANTWEFTMREWEQVLEELPEGVEVSHSVGIDEWKPIHDKEVYAYGGLAGGATSAGNTAKLAEMDRTRGREPYLETSMSHAWDLEPCIGTDFPETVARKCRSLGDLGARRFICRFGFASPPMVSRSINHELLRDSFFGIKDHDKVIADRARAWTTTDAEAKAVQQAWTAMDRALSCFPSSTWFVPGWSLSSWGQWLTRPLVPDRTRLTLEELEELTTHEFYLDNDPGRMNIFFEGYERIIRDDDSGWFVEVLDEDVLAVLDAGVAGLAELPEPSCFAGELRDRVKAHRHIITCYRNWLAGQRAINLALLENREDPGSSKHCQALRNAMKAEIENLGELANLLDRSPHELLLQTERGRNVYRYAQIARLLRKKIAVMARHLDDAPGPWLPQLEQARQRLSRPRPRSGLATSVEHLGMSESALAEAQAAGSSG